MTLDLKWKRGHPPRDDENQPVGETWVAEAIGGELRFCITFIHPEPAGAPKGIWMCHAISPENPENVMSYRGVHSLKEAKEICAQMALRLHQ